MTRAAAGGLGLLVLVVAAAAVIFHRASGGSVAAADATRDPLAAVALPTGPRPAFTPAKPTLLRRDSAATRVAGVERVISAHRRPGPGAVVATLSPLTPDGTGNIVVVDAETTRRGVLWVRVELPVLPNGTTGWVPRSSLGGYAFVDTRLVVDRARLTATLYRGRAEVFAAPIGVGAAGAPTPTGRFYVRERLTSLSSFYGPVAFGTNARSDVLTDWPGGGFIGIHGTNEPQLIPGRVSHGCIRMRNRDITRLAQLMPIGTPLTVR
jgi:L,D-transpeptidase catalytic domain